MIPATLVLLSCGTVARDTTLTKTAISEITADSVIVLADQTRELQETLPPSTASEVFFSIENENLYLSWEYSIPGDFNRDLTISGQDVFPLAIHFGHSSSLAGGERIDEQDDCIDGNRDGILNGLDLFAIAVNFGRGADSLHAFHRLGDPGFTLDDIAWEGDPAETEPPNYPVCAREFSLEIGPQGEEVHFGMIRSIFNGIDADSSVASWPEFSGTMTLDGEPNGAIPNWMGFSVELHGGAPPYQYSWDFGNGIVTAADSPEIDFVSSGPFKPVVTVKDSLERSVQVESPAEIAPSPREATTRLAVFSDELDGRFLYFLNDDGTDLTLADTANWIDISDDILVVSDFSFVVYRHYTELWVYLVDDQIEYRIAGEIPVETAEPPWLSPDGDWIFFKDDRTDQKPWPSGFWDRSYRIRPDGTDLQPIFPDELNTTPYALPTQNPATILCLEYTWNDWIQGEYHTRFVSVEPDSGMSEDIAYFEYQRFEPETMAMGNSIIYGRSYLPNNDGKQMVFKPDTGLLIDIEITNPPMTSLGDDLSTDHFGRKLAVTMGSELPFTNSVWMLYPDLHCAQKIWESDDSSNLHMLPDGSGLIFDNGSLAGPNALYRMSSDGAEWIDLKEICGFDYTTHIVIPGNLDLQSK